jgi:hypothetical protein
MALDLTILYRGPLSSCNYGCRYCPFAKHKEDRAAHAADGAALARLSHLPQVRRVAVQTNLSCRLDWVEACDTTRLALWATYHPTQTTRARFLAQCAELDRRGVRYSVGAVGTAEQADEIAALRRELPPHVYLWVNAYKPVPGTYTPDLIARFTEIDPLFPINNTRHASRGRPCRAGHTAISVDGDGTIRRCHFVRAPIGNLYEAGGVEAALRPRPCPNSTCSCHIGYIHLPHLNLDAVFGDGALERIPLDYVSTSGA